MRLFWMYFKLLRPVIPAQELGTECPFGFLWLVYILNINYLCRQFYNNQLLIK
jgi:hypothetical protein